jgi:hypothetical protein
LAMWSMDETALRRHHTRAPVLLVVDENAARGRDRAAWLGSLCARIEHLQPVQRLSLFAGRKSIAFYRGLVARDVRENNADDCIAWKAYLSAPDS